MNLCTCIRITALVSVLSRIQFPVNSRRFRGTSTNRQHDYILFNNFILSVRSGSRLLEEADGSNLLSLGGAWKTRLLPIHSAVSAFGSERGVWPARAAVASCCGPEVSGSGGDSAMAPDPW